MRFTWAILAFLGVVASSSAEQPLIKGTVAFRPTGDVQSIPPRYRLEAHEFTCELRLKQAFPVSGFDIFELRFPSPVETPHVENNTVHAEYYRPRLDRLIPCVIVLDITGGNQELSRTIARHLAQKGVGALFVQMAYYGPRRPPGSKLRLLSADVAHTLEAVRQTVLDLRRATAWMEARPEIDKTRLGIMGTSLGSFVAALTAEMEPKLGRVAILLGGGGFVDAYWDHPQAVPYRDVFRLFGGTKQQIKDWLAPLDPITCAANLKDRRVLIIAAKKDEIVPPRMAEDLWEATGRQRIIWLNAGHFSAAIYLLSGLNAVVEHFSKD
jgi:cephalosporin-C deacetylase-like acetyl esterase